MKTPDEIKKAMEMCVSDEKCHSCPYKIEECDGLLADALSYTKQLEQERDALLSIVRANTVCNYCKHGRAVCGSGADDCEDCTNTACPCRSCTKENDRWEWRGIKDGGAANG